LSRNEYERDAEWDIRRAVRNYPGVERRTE
jgi:hypothetical protein